MNLNYRKEIRIRMKKGLINLGEILKIPTIVKGQFLKAELAFR